MKILVKIIKWTAAILIAPAALFLVIQVWFYFTAPIYKFADPQPFSGDLWYNPYENMDSACWKKANFHFHTREWGGLTAGKNNSEEAFRRVYQSLGYDIPLISNYQSISGFDKDSSYYIGIYEHGYGIRKKHQLAIGATQVEWRDYSFYQNLHHRQHMINLLKKRSAIVALAHPGWDNGYPPDQIGMLSNYDLIEAVNGNYRSIPLWDSALSAGRPVYILADDDSHDLTDPGEIGICVTWINARDNTSEAILGALKTGCAYGMDVFREQNETWEDKILYHLNEMPYVSLVEITGDTLRVRVSERAMKITLTGQGGAVRKEATGTAVAAYALQQSDTYIRTQIVFFNDRGGPGTVIYLNPVFRYDASLPVNRLTAAVNTERTWIFRGLSFGSLILLVVFLVRLKKSRKKSAKADEPGT